MTDRQIETDKWKSEEVVYYFVYLQAFFFFFFILKFPGLIKFGTDFI